MHKSLKDKVKISKDHNKEAGRGLGLMVGDDRQLWTRLDDIRAGPGEEVTRL